jgi:AcrR family transcriptional regulator
MTVQKRALETRTDILRAAEELFASEGYDATGVAEICGKAGVSKGAFYHHFQTKEDVFLELLRGWLDGLEAQLSVLGGAEGTVSEKILNMASVMQDVLQAAQQGLPIYLEFWSRALRDPDVMELLIEPFHQFRAFFSGMLEEGVREGTLKLSDPTIAVQVFLSFAIGLLVQGIFEPDGVDWDRVSMEGINVLLRSYDKR